MVSGRSIFGVNIKQEIAKSLSVPFFKSETIHSCHFVESLLDILAHIALYICILDNMTLWRETDFLCGLIAIGWEGMVLN